MIALPEGFIWAEQVALGTPEVYRLSALVWPRFLLEESDMPDPILKFQIGLHDFNERFKIYGIREKATGQLVAFLQAVHVEVDLASASLPDFGWRFSIQNAALRSKKNALSLVEASVDAQFRGHGLAKCLIERAKLEARAWGFREVIAPVRPTLKADFPFEAMTAYCERRDARGRFFDPWLRTHVEAGARLANICHHSVDLRASLTKWREWTEFPLNQEGEVLVKGALTPVRVDLETETARYVEPNVWVRYVVS